MHAINWTSRQARRVARSTSTAELLAAADAVDKVTCLKHLPGDLTTDQPTELAIHSRSLFHLCTTMKEPEKARNKIILATIREEHHTSSLATIRWTPGTAHMADALTKDNPVIAAKLEEALASGRDRHDPLSYSIVSDVPPTIPDPSADNDQVTCTQTQAGAPEYTGPCGAGLYTLRVADSTKFTSLP